MCDRCESSVSSRVNMLFAIFCGGQFISACFALCVVDVDVVVVVGVVVIVIVVLPNTRIQQNTRRIKQNA